MQHLDDGSLQTWLDRSRSGMDEAEREEIGRHLASCRECSRKLEELDAMTLRIQSLLPAVEPASGDVPEWEAVVARARVHQHAGRRRPLRTAATWAAGVAAVMGLGWLSNDLYRSVETARSVARPAVEEPAAAPTEMAADVDESVAEPTEVAADAPAATGAPTQRVAEGLPEVARPAMPVMPIPSAGEAPATPAPQPERARLAAAPGPPVLRGRVTDESGRPLPSAQVFVSGMQVGALTNNDGTFSLVVPDSATGPGGLGARDVTLVAQLIGYGPVRRDLLVRAGDTVFADLAMAAQEIALDAMVITGATVDVEDEPEGRGLAASADLGWGGPWTPANRADAEAQAGFPLLVIADLRIVDIAVGAAGGAPAIRIVQELDDGARLTLVEGRGAGRFQDNAPTDAAAAPMASIRRGDVWVAATGSLPVDSLNALLRRLR